MIGKRSSQMDIDEPISVEQLPEKKLKIQAFNRARKEDYDPLKYRIKKEIGSGTFGVVFKAKNTHMNTTVAIKKTAQDPRNTNREFNILLKIDHPNCLKLISYYFTEEPESAGPKVPTNAENNGDKSPGEKSQNSDKEEPMVKFLNLVTPYYNQSLYKIIDFYRKMSKKKSTKASLPNTLVQLYSYQLLRALNYLKNKRIVHRDIKPSNILIDTKTQKLILADFGSAKEVILVPCDHNPEEKEIEKSVAYIVSRYYRAPELILGQEHYREEIDMWSVGCIMAEMWLGHPLFLGKNSQDQLFRIAQVLGKIGKLDKNAMNEDYTGPLPEINLDSQLNSILELSGADKLGIDLLTKILVYDPEKRITPLDALQHPYFDSLRIKKMKINGSEICDLFDFSEFELNGQERLRSTLVPKWRST